MMKFSVSNIGWNPSQDMQVAKFLDNSIFTGIEIAPSRYFEDVESTKKGDFEDLKNYWIDLGFPITSFQSLLFNRLDLQLFLNEKTRSALSQYLLSLGEKAAIIGAIPLVFGSPRNRNRGNYSVEEAKEIARIFFRELAIKWPRNSSYLVLEANPENYECNFITKSSEALEFVESVESDLLRWHLDLACTEFGNESSLKLIQEAIRMPSHVHISEEYLAPLRKSKYRFYEEFLLALKEREYKGVVTLEMRETQQMDDLYSSIDILNRVNLG